MTGPLLHIDRAQLVPLSLYEAFAFFADVSNLEAITPPWLRFRILMPQPVVVREGTLIDYRLTLHRVPVRWRTGSSSAATSSASSTTAGLRSPSCSAA